MKINRKKKQEKPVQNPNEYYPNISGTASYGDCTGVMPTPAQNEDELEAYQDLSSMEIPKGSSHTEKPTSQS